MGLRVALRAILAICVLVPPIPSRVDGIPTQQRVRIWCAAPVASGQHVAFRQTLHLSEAPLSATIAVDAAGAVEVAANGRQVLRASSGRGGQAIPIGGLLRRGRNVVAIRCDHRAAAAGLWFEIVVRYRTGRTAVVTSNGDERTAIDPSPGWSLADTRDESWPRAVVAALPAPPTLQAGQPASAPTATAAPVVAAAPAPAVAPPASGDASRLVRVWNVAAGGRPGDSLYGRERARGDRMAMCTDLPAPEDQVLALSAGFALWASAGTPGGEEAEPGVFDFGQAIETRRAAARMGSDWIHTTFVAQPPAWYARQVPYMRRTAVDGASTSTAFSPWEPRFAQYAGRVLGQVAERLGGVDGLGGVFVGLADPNETPGAATWWCGDPLARAAFGEAMLRRYGDVELLNAAWGTSFATAADVRFPASPADGRRRYWLDFVQWYRASLSAMADSLCRVARQALDTRLVVLQADHGALGAASGSDYSQLAKVSARHAATLLVPSSGAYPRSLGEGLGLAAAAGRYYGAPIWVQLPSDRPAGERIFAAASLGASGVRDTIAGIRSGREGYLRYGRHLRIDAPTTDVAMLYPTTSMILRGARAGVLAQGSAELRDVMDFDVIDERMVLDGALSRYRVLVLWEGPVYERETLDRIREWVRQGGVIVAYDFGKVETVEGDLGWFSDVFAHAGRLRRADPVWRFAPASGQRVRARYRVAVNLDESVGFLVGDWPVVQGARQAGPGAGIAWPVLPGRDYSLTVALRGAPPESSWTVFVNGVNAGAVAADRPATLRIPAAALAGSPVAVCTFQPRHVARTPADALAPVESVEIVAVGVGESEVASVALGGRMEAGIDLRRLRTEWTRPYGAGLAVYFPASRQNLRAYYEVVRTLTYRLADLDTGRRNALAVDDAWDGVYASLQSSRVLLYNAGERDVTRAVRIPSEGGERTVTVTINAGSVVEVPLGPPTVEMLFQCERFTSLRGARPQSGASHSPGRGTTHVLIPSGGSIETRFNVETPGVYTVFYRSVRRGARAVAEVSVNGVPVPRPLTDAPRLASAVTLSAGQVRLARGTHTLTLRPRRGEDLRADFVVLTNDPTIGGYGFAAP
ncbi:MAG TPA: beta-galactosidase [Chthonomonadales bacterium]|nr:beta-galactosidase [Chthonomonadales bacterium]